ncbi:MAG: hypothetical protein QOD69_3082 [Solirubrobacteraceae bacterium]|jgi:hypothetical protein|nr:hypothetical protein [Solirubrobacteraceae bacterium]
MTMKNILISVSAGIAAVVIVGCVVPGAYAVGEGLRVAGFLAVAGTIRAICGTGGLDGRSGRRGGSSMS